MKNIKRIAIFGSYNGTSIGDTAILLGLLSSIDRVCGEGVSVNVLVMSPINVENECGQLGIGINEIIITQFDSPAGLRESITFFLRKVSNKLFAGRVVKIPTLKAALRDVDCLLIGGGNLVMDLYPRGPLLLKEICDCADALNVEYFLLGVGAGPIYSGDGRRILSECLQKAQGVYCRDNASLELVQKELGIQEALRIPDLALGLTVRPHMAGEWTINDDALLLFNVASVYGKEWPIQDSDRHKAYVRGMACLAQNLTALGSFDKLVLFYSNYPLDIEGGEGFIRLFKRENPDMEVEVIDRKLSVADIVMLGERAKLAVVTRLHAGIMVGLGGCGVAAVCYQPKVQTVLCESGIGSVFFDLDFSDMETKVHDALAASEQLHSYADRGNKSQIDTVLNAILHTQTCISAE